MVGSSTGLLLTGLSLLCVFCVGHCSNDYEYDYDYGGLDGTFDPQPGNYSVVLGNNITYHSTFKTSESISSSWIIMLANGTHLLSSNDDHLARMQGLGIVISGDNLTVTATKEILNNTKIRRVVESTMGRDFKQAFSYDGSLKIQGPPSPPEPVLTDINSSLVHVSWPPPFTWTNHPITHYNITIINTTDQSSETVSVHSNQTSFSLTGGDGGRCDLLQVNMTATSDIGEGAVGHVTGGLPIAPAPFELMNCTECKVTFTADGNPMYSVKFKLPEICLYQTGHYHVWLYGPTSQGNQFRVAMNTYSLEDTVRPLTVGVGSGLMLNRTYTMVVTVSNTAGSTSANISFSTDYMFPVDGPVSTNQTPSFAVNGLGLPVVIGAVVMVLAVLVMIIVVVLAVVLMYRRKRRSERDQLKLAKIFMEDGSRSLHAVGGPYTQPKIPLYESIDGYQVEVLKKAVSPSCPTRGLPSLPPPRKEDLYQPEKPQIPAIVFEEEKESDAYLQLVKDKDKMDPEVRSTGSGEYTSMRSVSIKKELQNIVNMNRLAAAQSMQSVNENNYVVIADNGSEQ